MDQMCGQYVLGMRLLQPSMANQMSSKPGRLQLWLLTRDSCCPLIHMRMCPGQSTLLRGSSSIRCKFMADTVYERIVCIKFGMQFGEHWLCQFDLHVSRGKMSCRNTLGGINEHTPFGVSQRNATLENCALIIPRTWKCVVWWWDS